MGINASGQIVGSFTTVSGCGNCYGQTYPFLLSGGVYTALPEAPGSMPGTTHATAINSNGQIVGWYADPCFCAMHGFMLSGGAFTIIDDPGFFASAALGINDSGQIVGFGQQSWGASPANGFLLSADTFTTINDPLTTGSTVPTGINLSGQVVGYFSGVHGFLLSVGTYTTIDVPNGQVGTTEIGGPGINSSGQIVGTYTDLSGVEHGFLAMPCGTLPTGLGRINPRQPLPSKSPFAGYTFEVELSPSGCSFQGTVQEIVAVNTAKSTCPFKSRIYHNCNPADSAHPCPSVKTGTFASEYIDDIAYRRGVANASCRLVTDQLVNFYLPGSQTPIRLNFPGTSFNKQYVGIDTTGSSSVETSCLYNPAGKKWTCGLGQPY